MTTGLFEKGFDMESFIEKRLLEIDNLEDRKSARLLMEDVFRQIYRYTQEEYNGLQSRIEHQMQTKNEYTIVTGVIGRDQYDATNDELFPMIPDDLEEKHLDISDLLLCMREGRPYPVYSVFVEAGESVMKRLACKEECFPCKIRSMDGEYNGTVSVCRQTRYDERLKELYDMMQRNAVPWKTVCAPYLHKIFDVYIESADIPEDEQIADISIDFKEYTPYVRYHMVPVWNVTTEFMTADVQPRACADKVHYVHTIYGKRLRDNSRYLVAESEETILEVSHLKDFYITTQCKDAKRWKLCRIVNVGQRKYDYPPMSNERNAYDGRPIRTHMGIIKFLNMLGYREYMEIKKISFPDTFAGNGAAYPTEDYIDNEISIPQSNEVMLLEFECKNADCFLNSDIMSYLVTSLQREFREYRCVGTFKG